MDAKFDKAKSIPSVEIYNQLFQEVLSVDIISFNSSSFTSFATLELLSNSVIKSLSPSQTFIAAD